MKLKTAIYIIDSSYGFFIISGLIGIVLCIATLRDVALLVGIIAVVVLFIVAFLVKRHFINLYLENCKYPFEFLSVLEQLGLIKELQISWSEVFINGPEKRLLKTQEFLRENQLNTNYRRKRRRIAFSNDQDGHSEMLSFQEAGLLLENTSYEWSRIKDWGYIDSDTHAGKMEITYEDGESQKQLLLNLEHFGINHIDLMLLLSHFKAKYGS